MVRRSKFKPRGGDSSMESLRGKNRELQKTIKQLQQRVRQLEKQLELPSTITNQDNKNKIPAPPQIKTTICDNCGKGEMEEYKLEGAGKILLFWMCKICKHRKRVK